MVILNFNHVIKKIFGPTPYWELCLLTCLLYTCSQVLYFDSLLSVVFVLSFFVF